METFLSGLALASVAGISWVAWHEHETFNRIHVPLQRGLFAIIMFALGYNMAILQILYKPDDLKSISGAQLATMITESFYSPQVFLLLLASMAYMAFLWLLPVIRRRPGDESKNDIEPKDSDSEG